MVHEGDDPKEAWFGPDSTPVAASASTLRGLGVEMPTAGRLIDVAGCKGLRVGGAVVSEKHANFFVAEAGATARDVYALICQVRRRVADATGVYLEPELRLVGFGSEEVQR